jgi:hypothetical protein
MLLVCFKTRKETFRKNYLKRKKWHHRSPRRRNQSPNLPNLSGRRRKRKNPKQSPPKFKGKDTGDKNVPGSAEWKKAKANKARNKRKQTRKISGPLFPVSLRISGADQGSLLLLKEWRSAHVAAATWLLDALLRQTQATLSEIKVEEGKFVEHSGPRGVKTSLMDPEERMGYGICSRMSCPRTGHKKPSKKRG